MLGNLFSMTKNCMRYQICQVLAAMKPQIRSRALIPALLLQLNVFLLLSAIPSSAWGQFFESPPRVIDDANDDTVFSPNGDGIQDNLIISFVTNGFTGDYRIMIDVHGPGAVGRPDGKFDIDDDWFVKGKVGPGPTEFQPHDYPKIVHQEWDGMSRAPSQEGQPNARPVGNGSYEILVETDAFEDGVVNIIDFTYQSSKLTAVVDVDAPQISSTVSHLFFSPNSDEIKDSTIITYTLSEHLSELRLEFADRESQPPIQLPHITRGRQSFIWSGTDGLRIPLIDGTYNLRLRGIDNGGNVTTFDVGSVQIDTRAPTFSQISPSPNSYLKTSVAAIEVEFNPVDQESPIDFDSSVTTVSLQNAGGGILSGITRSDVANNRLTLTLDNPLDTISENGTYTTIILGADEAGNRVETESSFNFDTVAPTLERIRSNYGNFPPSGSVNAQITFVEVDLDDNIDDGLNLSASVIALNGPNGPVLGNQTFGGDSTLRWNLGAPVATDGSADGIYIITINATDRAGNTSDFGEVSFIYDTQAPRLVSLTPNLEDDTFHLGGGTIFRSQPLSRVVAGFSDDDGSGVDLASTRLEIFRSDETGAGNIFLVGTRHLNPTDGTLALQLSQPLANQDGTQDGAYTIRVTSVDVAGNTGTNQVDLIYDTEVPTIVSVTPERDATIASLSHVTVVMDDRVSGIDFANTVLKLVRDNVEIRGTSSNNGTDTAVLTLSNPMSTDGSDDGEYGIEITTVDRAGNASDLIESRFFYVSQLPEIRLNAPAKKAVNALTMIDVQLYDYIGPGVDFSPDKSSVVVRSADGTTVPSASVEVDKVNNRLVWMGEAPLPRDGSADGVYTAHVAYQDIAGRNFTQDFVLTFDTQLPSISQTTPIAGARVDEVGTITVEFHNDLSGVDFSAVQVQLLDPNGVAVGTNRSDNGVDTITLRVQELQGSAVEGIYIIEVTPADRAGNIADSPFLSGFTYAPREPLILLQPSANLPINQLNQITATLQDYVGPGIDFDTTETSISVRNTSGAVIASHPIQSNEVELQLTWTALSPLPRDGSADGLYRVISRFVESLGPGTASPATFERTTTLFFDTQPPQILSTVPTRNSRITRLQGATVELGDNLSGVDFDSTVTQLLAPDNNPIPTSISNDGERRITLSFDPLKIDGSDDGVHRLEITPVDLAGNVGGVSMVEFVYVTQGPEIEMMTPVDGSIVNRVPEINVLIRDNSGEGIDFEKSMITLSDASGTGVQGILGDDEERTLTLRVGLPTDGTADGVYTVNLNLVDNLGVDVGYTRQFMYDSVPPTIVTESRPPRENIINDNRIVVDFEVADMSPVPGAASGVDFGSTTIQLHDANGDPIAGETRDDGVKLITFTSAELTSVGVYTLTVMVADHAGNVSVPQQFTYADEIKPPRVVSLSPPTKSRVNRLTEISSVLDDQSGAGIDFSPAGSTIELRSPNDVVVGGNVVNNGVDTLTLKLIDPLLADGSDDGVYTISVQPVDLRGVRGEIRQFTITYDTQKPRVQSVSHIDMTSNVSNINDSVRRIEAELIETGSGIDFERSHVQLRRHTEGERVLVPGTLDYDNGLVLWWQLNSPLALDGEDDGVYSVEVKAVDNAGNVEEKEYSFLYDTQAPIISSVQASVVARDALELETGNIPNDYRIMVELEVTDAPEMQEIGSGVDFDATTIQLQDSDGEPIAGEKRDDGVKLITFTSSELTSVGVYTVIVVVADRVGNVGVPQRFIYRDQVKPPRVASITPATKSRVNRLTEISSVLDDQSGAGIDFSPAGSTIELRSPNDVVVGGNVVNNGVDTLTLKLIDPLLADGSDDGVYTISVQPVDLRGVRGEIRQFTITYDTQKPRVQSVSHIDMTSNVSNINDSVRRIEAELIETGSGIDFERSHVQLRRHTEGERVLVPGTLDYDNGLVLWWQLNSPLALDGEDDGVYSVEVKAVDNAGNVEEKEYSFLYDTQAPIISSVQASVVARDALELETGNIPNDYRIMVELEVTDAPEMQEIGSGVDFDATTIQLQDSDGEPIAGEKRDDGVKLITFTSSELTSVGVYTVIVVVADRVGNVGVPQRFIYRDQVKPPRVASITPATKSRVNRLTEISSVLDDQSGAGIDFSPAGSTIELRSPNDVVVGGIVTHDGVDTLTLNLADPLLTDGSDDGVYTISVQPVDLRGVRGEIRQFTITYDTQKPRVQSVSHIDMTSNVSNINDSVRRIEAELIETGSGIDFERSHVQLRRHTEGERVLVPGTLDYDNGLVLWWQLNSPLALDGEDDGVYSVEVKAADNAGNVEEKEYSFLYDTQAPIISSVQASVVARDALELETGNIPNDYRIMVELEVTDAPEMQEIGSGVDFDATTIQLQDSDGEPIAGEKRDDGVKLITFTSSELTSVGVYTVIVVVADRVGNVGVPQRFIYRDQVKPPRVTSITPATKSRVNRLIEISSVLEDQSGAGIDFSPTGSTIELRSPNDVVVGGNVVNNGVDTLTLKLIDPLLADGSDDGVYTISVQPVDLRGVHGEIRQFTITYDTQKPRVQSVSHIDMTANVSIVNDSVRRVATELADDGSGIYFGGSFIQLWRHTEDGRVLVPGTLANDEVLLWWQLDNPLARNGADDGLYSVEIKAVDYTGNLAEKEYGLLYDTQVPVIDSVQASAVAGDSQELDTRGNLSVVKVPINQIHLVFFDQSGSGIDVSQTMAQLIHADEMEVSTTQQNDGVDTISLKFRPLRDDGTEDGRYFIRVTPIDFAGNTLSSPMEVPFLYATRAPEIVSTTPAEFASVNLLDSVSAVLLDHSGEGIDFDRSTIGLHNSEGDLIDGRQHVTTEGSVITWELDRPLSRDGVADGEYSIRIAAFNGVGGEIKSSKTFLYDTQIPRIVSVSADTIPATSIPVNELVVLNHSFAQMTIELTDEHTGGEQISTSGVNFVGTTVRLIGPNDEEKDVTASDDGEAQLIIRFTPLVQPGAYTLEITPRDFADNVSGHAIQYNFSLDLAKPRVESVLIGGHTAPVAFVNQLQRITVKLVDPNEVGLDLTSGGSTLHVLGPNGVVDGLQEGRGNDELVWTPLHLPEDGTADGRYTVTVTPVDSLGLSGVSARYEFILDTEKPELISVSPIDSTQAVSYIGEQIIQISAQVADVGPAGLDISTQTVQLQDGNGSLVPANLTSDGDSQVFLTLAQPLATNGINDGEYSVVISLRDRAGNTHEVEHTFVYDTQAPTLANTDPSGDLIRDDLTTITADLNDLGGSGIDFTVTHLTLIDPNNNEVSGQLSNDGVAQLILRLDELAEDGNYRIRVLAVDRAGNGVDAPFDRTFLFSTNLPTVVSTIPVTAPAESAFARTPPNQVEVKFQSSPNLSTVKLIHPNGTTVPGQQIRDGNRLIYRLSRELASDGSDDGSYTILVTPVNSAGRSGEQQQFNFIYDTVPPEVDGILPIVESPGVNNALNEILTAVSDASPSSSIDWDELDDSWMTFEKIGTEEKIRGRLTTDREQLISFHLESPLASDGSQDGKYLVTVMPRDKAGNVAIPTILEFVLDTRPPIIHTDSLLINDRPLYIDTNHPDYPSADGSGSGVVIQARMSDLASDGNAGLGVDLSQSSIGVTAPDGTTVTGNLIQNGTDTIVFRSGPLIARGFYQVEITSVGLDVAGLGFAPTASITTRFLHETTEPVAELTDFGGKTELTDQSLPLRGTATDPASVIEDGASNEQGETVSASGIAYVEIVGTGPDGLPIEPVLAIDESGAESEAWSSWSLDFLPARSGGYHLNIRVTDRAGNVAIYDGVNVNLSVSLTYRGSTYSWPSPLKRSTGDRAHFSFDVNLPSGSKINMTLSVYDFSGDLVFEDTFANIGPGRDSDQLVTWDLKNQAGAAVARGVYIFRLEAEDVATKNRSNAVGKMLVIE